MPTFTVDVGVQERLKLARGQLLRIESVGHYVVQTRIVSVKLGDAGWVVEYEVIAKENGE